MGFRVSAMKKTNLKVGGVPQAYTKHVGYSDIET